MNDAYSEITERESLQQLTSEIGYMDSYIPELKDIKGIWLEFLPAMRTAVSNKAVSFVRGNHGLVTEQISAKVAAGVPHLETLLKDVEFFLQNIEKLKCQSGNNRDRGANINLTFIFLSL